MRGSTTRRLFLLSIATAPHESSHTETAGLRGKRLLINVHQQKYNTALEKKRLYPGVFRSVAADSTKTSASPGCPQPPPGLCPSPGGS